MNRIGCASLKPSLPVLGALFLIAPAVAWAQKPRPDTTLVYKRVGEAVLRLHVFRPADHARSNTTPAIVFFFGGGWNSGSPRQFYPQARYFASRGLVAISAEYRTKTSHGTTPFQSVEDGMSAVRWIRSHAAELGIDPFRLVAAGGSAGGQIAAATAMLKAFDAPGEDTLVSRRPNALVLFNPVLDNGPGGYGFERIGKRYREFSPLHNVDSTAPPTLVLLGTADHLIPVATAQRFQTEMHQAGVRSELRLYEGQEHGFFNHRDGNNPYYDLSLSAADEFLQSLGYLDPPVPEKRVRRMPIRKARSQQQQGFRSRVVEMAGERGMSYLRAVGREKRRYAPERWDSDQPSSPPVGSICNKR